MRIIGPRKIASQGTNVAHLTPPPGVPRLNPGHDPIRGHPGDRPAAPPRGRPRHPPPGVHLLGGRAQGAGPRLGRALPRAPPRGRRHPRRDADGPDLRRGRAPARRPRGHPDHPRAAPGVLRQGRAPHRRGRHEDLEDPVRHLRGAPGRDLPEDAPGDGRRHPRHPRQARRPAPQHAHAAAPARRPPAAHLARDPRHLRPDRGPARDGEGQERARGPRLPVPRPRRLQDARRARRGAPAGGEPLHRADPLDGGGEAALGRGSPRPSRAGSSACTRSTRSSSASGSTSSRSTTSWRFGSSSRRVPDCYAALGVLHNTWRPGARADQGLHRDAAAERLPVAPHVGDRRRGAALRGADPHARDAPRRRGGHRRPLEVQGGPHRRRQGRPRLLLAAPAPRVAAGGQGPPRVPELAQARPLPGGGLLLHAEGRGPDAAARAPRRSTSPTRSTPRSATSAWARA